MSGSAATPPEPIVREIVAQHVSDAAFLWSTRTFVLRGHVRLRELLRLDARVDAHLDGVRVAGDPGIHLCERQAESEPSEGLFVPAVLALERREMLIVERLLRLAEAAIGQRIGYVRSVRLGFREVP